jgi:murein DD-endopeptidase MepM/ murein hydrolase activator NlpD
MTIQKIPFHLFRFHPVIHLPKDYVVLDLSQGPPSNLKHKSVYSVGRYAEKRKNMYTQDLFAQTRDIHVGIDIGAPAGEPAHAFADGEIFLFADNKADGDYGPTVITRHALNGVPLYALYGHLSRRSLDGKSSGQKFRAGDVLGHLGSRDENGGWPPHVHFQLSYHEPKTADLPGVVSDADLESALEIYPDPRLVLGPLY